MKMGDKITKILEDEPQSTDVEIESPDYNPDDFDKSPGASFEQSETEPGREPKSNQDGSSESDLDNEEPGSTSDDKSEEEKKPETEPERQVREIKSEVAKKLLDPETAVAMADMLLSRAGTIANKSKKDDWKLDDDEKEIFEKLLSATMEEEGMEFWPAKYWILIAIVMIYGFKGIDVWDEYYSEDGKIKHNPIKKKEQDNKADEEKRKKAKAELERLVELVEMERKKKELLDELEIMTEPSGNDSEQQQKSFEEETKTEEAEGIDVTEEEKEEKERPPEKIHPDDWQNYRYVYDKEGNLVRNKGDKLPKKRPGRKIGDVSPRNEKGFFIKTK